MRDAVRMECPQCAVKHLAASMAYFEMAYETQEEGQSRDRLFPAVVTPAVLAARAYVCLAEELCGYTTHLPLAIGFIVSAEEMSGADETLREIRIGLQDALAIADRDERARAVTDLRARLNARLVELAALDPGRRWMTLAAAHLAEARRECADVGMPDRNDYPAWCIEQIETIVAEYWGDNGNG